MTGPGPADPGHAAASRSRPRPRLDATVVVAALVPVVVLALALLTSTDVPRPVGALAPQQVPLTRTDLVCGGDGAVQVATDDRASGEVAVSEGRARGRDAEQVEVEPGRITEVAADDAVGPGVVVTATGDLAPALVAARFASPLAATECGRPVVEQWFTGVGAGARHRSMLQLVNPDAGRAVVDIEVLGRTGQVEADRLLGVAIRGGGSRSFDLAEVLPRRDELALHVTVVRGRVGATVVDSVRPIGSGRSGDDVISAQPAPSATQLLLGLPTGRGPRQLVVANPGDDEARATLQLVTGDSAFSPEGLQEVVIAPRSTVTVRLGDVIAEAGSGAGTERPLGLLLEATAPVTSSFAYFAGGDLANLVPAEPVEGPAVSPLPAGDKELLVGGADTPGEVAVSMWDGDGEPLPDQRVEVTAGGVARLELPAATRLLRIEPGAGALEAVVGVSGADGVGVIRLRQPVGTGAVPSVSASLLEWP